MPLVDVTFKVGGETQLARAFELTAREAGDLSEPLEEIGHQLILHIGEQFRTEGKEGGHPWPDLDTEYERWKDANAPAGPGAPILVFSGAMRAAALDYNARVSVTPNRLVYELDGPEGERASYHQGGDGHLPQRRLIDLTQAFNRKVDRTFHEWITAIRRSSFTGRPR